MKLRNVVVGALALAAALTTTSTIALANLITNGDFTNGQVGWSTDYNFVPVAPNALVPEGNITIANNPISVHDSWVDQNSPFNLLIVNGATSGSPTIWQETGITTTTAGTYHFSANVMDLCCNSSFGSNANSPSNIRFEVNVNSAGWVDLADYLTTPGVVAQSGDSGVLGSISGDFVSTIGGTFDIRAINDINLAGGNDFALANISVTSLTKGGSTPVPEPLTLSLFGAGLAGIAAMRRRQKAAQA